MRWRAGRAPQGVHSPAELCAHLSGPPSSAGAAAGCRRRTAAAPSRPAPSGCAGLRGGGRGSAPTEGSRSAAPQPCPPPYSHLCMGQAHSAPPLLLSGRQSCGDKDMSFTARPVTPGCCVPAARTDLHALPRRHVLLQLLLQQPRAAGSLRGEGFVGCVVVVTPPWGPGDAYRGGEAGEGRAVAPLQGAERRVPPWFHQQEVIHAAGQRSWGQEAVAGHRGSAPGPDPAPGTASALPACVQQYSRSCRHCISRTCPPLLTCRREQVGEAAHGAAAG